MSNSPWKWPKEFPMDLFKSDRIYHWPNDSEPNKPIVPIGFATGGTMAFENAPSINSLYDTGADAPVIISPALSKRIGATHVISMTGFRGMSGEVDQAPVVLIDLKVEGITLVNVPAVVTDIPGELPAIIGNEITNFFNCVTAMGVTRLSPNENIDRLKPYRGRLRAV